MLGEDSCMRNSRFNHLLSGTALAMFLVVGGGVHAAPTTPDPTEAGVPMPEPANVAPLTPADVGAKAPVDDKKKQDTATTPAPGKPETADSPPPAQDQAKPTIATTLAPADQAVAEKMRDLLGGKADRILGGKKERTVVEAFYASRGFAPLWIENGAGSGRAKAAIAHLSAADADGLDPSDYPTPDLKAAATPDALAEAELKLTAWVLTYARQAQAGRIHFSRVSADISYTPVAPEVPEVLAKMAETKNVDDALDGFNPPQPGYKALKAKLAE